MTTPVCHICDHTSNYLLQQGGYVYYRCPSCDLVFIWPQPSYEYLAEDVYSPKSGYQKNKNKNLSQVPVDNKKKKILNYLGRGDGKSLLDVGCSNGEFLYLARERGFTCSGIELNKTTADIAKDHGFNITLGTLENVYYPDNSFSVVNLGDLIEHVADPRALLQKCFTIIKPGGFITITTPNLDCFWAKAGWYMYRLFRIPWSSVTPPYHLFQFSTNNLSILLKQIGFSIDTIWFNRPPRLRYELGMLHLWGRYKKDRRIINLLYTLFAFSLYALVYTVNWVTYPVRTSDGGLVIVAKKPE